VQTRQTFQMSNTSRFSKPASAASASASIPTPLLGTPNVTQQRGYVSHDDEEDFLVSLRATEPPSLSQLRSLTAVPAGLVKSMNNGSSAMKARKGKKGGGKLAKEGQIVSISFDALGRRPQPTNHISLEQGITVELSAFIENYLTTPTTVGFGAYAGLSFTLGFFSAATPLATVFDQYRFQQVEVWFEYSQPNAGVAFPELTTAVDLDDAAVPTGPNMVQDHQGALISAGPGGHYHKFKPHMAVAVYSGTFTSFANEPAAWIDIASPNVQHYGVKTSLTSNSTTPVSINVVLRAVISFRAPVIN